MISIQKFGLDQCKIKYSQHNLYKSVRKSWSTMKKFEFILLGHANYILVSLIIVNGSKSVGEAHVLNLKGNLHKYNSIKIQC